MNKFDQVLLIHSGSAGQSRGKKVSHNETSIFLEVKSNKEGLMYFFQGCGGACVF